MDKKAPIECLPPDVRAIVDSIIKLLMNYMGGQDTIQMLVGRNVTAELKFSGGPITQEVIADTLAHLAFYKKYFPKDADGDGRLDTPEKILGALATQWEDHRAALAKQTPAGSA